MLDILEMIICRFEKPMRFSVDEMDESAVYVILEKHGVDLVWVDRTKNYVRFDLYETERKLKKIRADLDRFVVVKQWHII